MLSWRLTWVEIPVSTKMRGVLVNLARAESAAMKMSFCKLKVTDPLINVKTNLRKCQNFWQNKTRKKSFFSSKFQTHFSPEGANSWDTSDDFFQENLSCYFFWLFPREHRDVSLDKLIKGGFLFYWTLNKFQFVKEKKNKFVIFDQIEASKFRK